MEIPGSVKTILSYAFSGCISLKEAVLNEGVSIIGEGVFCGCDVLSNVKLPQSLSEIQKDAFYYCEALEEISYAGTKKQWSAVKKNPTWRDWTPLKVVHCSDGDVAIKEKAFKKR